MPYAEHQDFATSGRQLFDRVIHHARKLGALHPTHSVRVCIVLHRLNGHAIPFMPTAPSLSLLRIERCVASDRVEIRTQCGIRPETFAMLPQTYEDLLQYIFCRIGTSHLLHDKVEQAMSVALHHEAQGTFIASAKPGQKMVVHQCICRE
jgi:hypothetical protein